MNFIILGYGVPKNVLNDNNYNFYLRTVFNKIFDLARSKKAIIIFSGGKTNLLLPYNKSEGSEMLKLFRVLCRRKFLASKIRNWKILAETTAISTLENLVNSRRLLKSKKLLSGLVYIFCEQTRGGRVKIIARKIFGKNIKVISIDFDNNSNRYLAEKFIREKESRELKLALWSLKNPENFKQAHQFYQDKFKYFRKIKKSGEDVNFIREWWETKQREFINKIIK